MCNLYNVSTNQEAIRALTRTFRDMTGNLPPSLDVYPDYPAPVVRIGEDGKRELVNLRWGMPSPPQYAGPPITNIRNTASSHWRRWLGPQNRCVVPATTFSEWEDTKPKKTKRWFAINEDRPLFFFAGIWTKWHGQRKKAEGPMDHEIFGFLTTDANEVVKPIHPKAMPVILTTQDEIETWLTAEWSEVSYLQHPLPVGQLILLGNANEKHIASHSLTG